MTGRGSSGYSVVELLVSLALLGLAMGGLAALLVQNSQVHRVELMKAEIQMNARNSLSMITQVLRRAGWDPMNSGMVSVVLDPSPTNSANYIEVLADLNEDGDVMDDDERVLIRWFDNRIEWRRTADVSSPFIVLADNITNDADQDGVAETMFVPDATPVPTRITVRITARSAVPDPRSGRYLVYTASSDVVLRKAL
ncbi:MAG: hypothetical protein ACRD5D_00020 [Candidatus Polarisedimenticolia bacterium]